MDDFSFSVLKDIGKRASVSITELAAIYNRSVEYMADPVLYLRKCGYLGIERNYANLHNLTSDSPIGYETPMILSYLGKVKIESEQRERRRFSFSELRAWSTLIIAFAALIVSVIALKG